jgi:hypothetical protein
LPPLAIGDRQVEAKIDPPGDARLLVALMDGLLLDQLSAPRSPLAADTFTDQLRRFLGGLLA